VEQILRQYSNWILAQALHAFSQIYRRMRSKIKSEEFLKKNSLARKEMCIKF
jgi:hypothetical protein